MIAERGASLLARSAGAADTLLSERLKDPLLHETTCSLFETFQNELAIDTNHRQAKDLRLSKGRLTPNFGMSNNAVSRTLSFALEERTSKCVALIALGPLSSHAI